MYILCNGYRYIDIFHHTFYLFSFLVLYLQKVYKILKDSLLKKCLEKRRALSRSGAAASTLPTCKYFEVMRFLHEKTSNLETQSNVELEIVPISNSSTYYQHKISRHLHLFQMTQMYEKKAF